jgi:hypothetical protein
MDRKPSVDPHSAGCACERASIRRYAGFVPSYRLIDMAGSEIGIIEDERERIELDDEVTLPDGGTGTVADVYDDEFGQEGGVAATLAVDDGSPQY